MADVAGTNPLDAALESIEREDLAGGSARQPEGDAFAPPPSIEPEQLKKPGRKRDPNSRRSRSGKYKGGASAPGASGPVSDPPLPVTKVDYPKIDPASVSESIQQIDALIVKVFGTQPLSPKEAEGGGVVFAPVLDHYMPLLAEKGGLWIAPLTWVVLAYGPRAYEVLDARQKAVEAKRNGFTQGAQSGENGKRTFQATLDSRTNEETSQSVSASSR